MAHTDPDRAEPHRPQESHDDVDVIRQTRRNPVPRRDAQADQRMGGAVRLHVELCIAEATVTPDQRGPPRIARKPHVEHLTDEIEQASQEILDRIEDMGGAVAAIESGYTQREIQEAAVRQQQEIESGRRVIIGVNKFTNDEEAPQMIFRVNTDVADAQIERLRRLRAERDGEAARAALVRLSDAARGEDNLMPPLIDAVKSYATLGEICGELRTVFGEYRAPTAV